VGEGGKNNQMKESNEYFFLNWFIECVISMNTKKRRNLPPPKIHQTGRLPISAIHRPREFVSALQKSRRKMLEGLSEQYLIYLHSLMKKRDGSLPGLTGSLCPTELN